MTYTTRNGVRYPDLMLEEPETAPGKYGLLRLRYLEKSDPGQLNILLLEGALNSHLAQIDRQVRGQVEQTMERLVQRTKAAGQTDGPTWLGRDDEQPAPASGGNGDGTDLRQLSLFPAEEEIQETGRSGTERPVSLSPDEIDDILRCDREYKKAAKTGYRSLFQHHHGYAGTQSLSGGRHGTYIYGAVHRKPPLRILQPGQRHSGILARRLSVRAGENNAHAVGSGGARRSSLNREHTARGPARRISHRGGREGGASGWNGGPENGAGRVQRS